MANLTNNLIGGMVGKSWGSGTKKTTQKTSSMQRFNNFPHVRMMNTMSKVMGEKFKAEKGWTK